MTDQSGRDPSGGDPPQGDAWAAPGGPGPSHHDAPSHLQPGGFPQQPPVYHALPPVGGAWGVAIAPQPGVIPLRALGVGDMFEGAMRTIRGNPAATLGLSFLVSLLLAVPAAAMSIALSSWDGGSEALRNLVSYASTDGYNLLTLVGSVFLTGMLVAVVSQAVLGRRTSIGEAWKQVSGRVWALVGVGLLRALIPLGPLVLSVVVTVLISDNDAALAGGVLLSIAAGFLCVFLWIKLEFAASVTVLERHGPITALKRSWALTRDQWWRVFGISLLTVVLVGIVVSILAFIPALIIVGATLASDPAATADSLGVVLTLLVVNVVITTLTAPFSAGVSSLLYIDQRIRKEALDVTLMAAAGQTSGPR